MFCGCLLSVLGRGARGRRFPVHGRRGRFRRMERRSPRHRSKDGGHRSGICPALHGPSSRTSRRFAIRVAKRLARGGGRTNAARSRSASAIGCAECRGSASEGPGCAGVRVAVVVRRPCARGRRRRRGVIGPQSVPQGSAYPTALRTFRPRNSDRGGRPRAIRQGSRARAGGREDSTRVDVARCGERGGQFSDSRRMRRNRRATRRTPRLD